MKRKIFAACMAMMCCLSGQAQVQFTNFNLRAVTMYDWSEKMLKFKFKVTADKDIKYVNVEWAGVNQVGDAIVSNIRGAVNANVTHTKLKVVKCTGPFKSGKSFSRVAQPYYYSGKGIKAFPKTLYIDYMGGGSDTINITKENIKTYFPCVEWMDVDYESGFQPSN